MCYPVPPWIRRMKRPTRWMNWHMRSRPKGFGHCPMVLDRMRNLLAGGTWRMLSQAWTISPNAQFPTGEQQDIRARSEPIRLRTAWGLVGESSGQCSTGTFSRCPVWFHAFRNRSGLFTIKYYTTKRKNPDITSNFVLRNGVFSDGFSEDGFRRELISW